MKIRFAVFLFIAFFAANLPSIAETKTPNGIASASSKPADVLTEPLPDIPDKDTLDIAGDWKLTYGYGVGFPLISPQTQPVHFDVTGPGTHGGVKFKGHYTDGHPGNFVGETFYNGRGVQVVQMTLTCEPLRYIEVLCGKHVKDKAKVWVMGAWANVGNAAGGAPDGGSGYLANFEMIKIIKAVAPPKPK